MKTFKTATIFTGKFNHTPDSLESMLSERAFKSCESRQLESYGWVPPIGENLVHSSAGFMLLKARREERILPSSVIADHMAEKIEHLEQTLDRKIRGKEKLDIRDNVIMELTPQAFTKSTYEHVLIMPEQKMIVIDSASAKKVDQCTSLLRESVGSLPIVPLETEQSPAELFTRWIKGARKLPEDFSIGGECKMADVDDITGTVTCQNQDLNSDEVKAMSSTGKLIIKMQLETETASFVINERLEFSKIKLSTNDENDDQSDLDAAAIFDGNFTLMALEFSKLFPRVVDVFGGVKEA